MSSKLFAFLLPLVLLSCAAPEVAPTQGGVSYFILSWQGKEIAYVQHRNDAAAGTLMITPLGTTGGSALLPNVDVTWAAFLPHDSQIVALDSSGGIWITPTVPGSPGRKLGAGVPGQFPVISPDGLHVLFPSCLGPNDTGCTLMAVAVNGGAPAPLVGNVPFFEPVVGFAEPSAAVVTDLDQSLWLAPITGGQPTLLASHIADPRMASDGSKIAYIANASSAGVGDLDLLPLGGTMSPQRIATGVSSEDMSADGAWLVFNGPSGSLWASSTAGGAPVELAPNGDLVDLTPVGGLAAYLAPVDGSATGALNVVSLPDGQSTPVASASSGARFTPDQTRLAYIDAQGSVWSALVGNWSPVQILSGGPVGGALPCDLSPNSVSIACIDEALNLWVGPVAAPATKIASSVGAVFTDGPSFSADGAWFAFGDHPRTLHNGVVGDLKLTNVRTGKLVVVASGTEE